MLNVKEIKKNYKKTLVDIAHREFEKNQIVLVGDCLFKYLDMDRELDGLTIYNNAICGDTSELLKESLYKRVVKYKPKKVFISIGSHDFGFNDSKVKTIYNNIISIVEEIEKRSKHTKIVLLTVPPVNIASMDFINRDYVDSRDNFDIKMLNYYIINYCRKNKIEFIDAYKQLKNEVDQLHLKFTSDGYHLNETGNNKLVDLILDRI